MDKTHIYRFTETPEQLAAVMADLDFHFAFDQQRDDISGTEMRPGGQDGDVQLFTMLTQEFKRSKTGKINRSATTEGRTDFRWDPTARTLGWIYYSGEEPKRIRIGGNYRIVPDGAGCQLIHDYTIDIKIPLIGGQVSKLVDREFVKSFVRFEALVRTWLAR